jgi:glucose/arabinose dehydrogenase
MRLALVSSLLLLVACSSGHDDVAPSAPEPMASEPTPAPPLAGQEEVELLAPEPEVVPPGAPVPPAEVRDAAIGARPTGARLGIPEGFRVQLVAEGLGAADALAIGPSAELFVIARDAGEIRRLVDADHDGVAEERALFGDASNGLDHPSAMVFTPGAVFVVQSSALMRHALPEGQERLLGSGGRVAALPASPTPAQLLVSADRRNLYVTVGAAQAGARRGTRLDPEAASILEVNFSGARRRVFASGLQHATGLAIQPRAGALWATVSEEPARAFLARIEDGAFYGVSAVGSRSARAPEVPLVPASRPSGLAFATGTAFPERYRGGAFVCDAGSGVRAPRVLFVPFGADGAPSGPPELFVTGFAIGVDASAVWGRPSGIVAHPDGSLLFSDGPGGRVFRVSAG